MNRPGVKARGPLRWSIIAAFFGSVLLLSATAAHWLFAAVGISSLGMALIPCGQKKLRRGWPLRLRNAYFIVTGCASLFTWVRG